MKNFTYTLAVLLLVTLTTEMAEAGSKSSRKSRSVQLRTSGANFKSRVVSQVRTAGRTQQRISSRARVFRPAGRPTIKPPVFRPIPRPPVVRPRPPVVRPPVVRPRPRPPIVRPRPRPLPPVIRPFPRPRPRPPIVCPLPQPLPRPLPYPLPHPVPPIVCPTPQPLPLPLPVPCPPPVVECPLDPPVCQLPPVYPPVQPGVYCPTLDCYVDFQEMNLPRFGSFTACMIVSEPGVNSPLAALGLTRGDAVTRFNTNRATAMTAMAGLNGQTIVRYIKGGTQLVQADYINIQNQSALLAP